MPHLAPLTSNASLSSASSVGVVMRDTPTVCDFEVMGDDVVAAISAKRRSY